MRERESVGDEQGFVLVVVRPVARWQIVYQRREYFECASAKIDPLADALL